MTAIDPPSPISPLIMKFGGTSVGTADAIRRTADIIARHARSRPELVIVVSAMRGITEALLACTESAAAGQKTETAARIEGIARQSLAVIRDLFPNGSDRLALEQVVAAAVTELSGVCTHIGQLRRAEPFLIDAAASLGERLNARVVASQLRAAGPAAAAVEATRLIRTDRRFLNAAPLAGPTRRRTRRVLMPLLAQGVIPVVTGFIGAARDGRITTLGRGGSDYTASILGAALDAGEVWIWTDVDGVMTADPCLVPGAAVIPQIGYADVHELAHFGGRVLHPNTITPVRKRGIAVRVLNTFAPDAPGTLIGRSAAVQAAGMVVTLLSGCRLDKAGRALVGSASRAGRPFPVRMPSGFAGPVSVVSLVGRSACVREIRDRAFRALDRHGIAVYGSSQARARNRLSLLVPDAAALRAVCTIHNEVVQP